ncbi:hypothetical protein XH92_36785 [Bradyrhizobium sp. CCBAU 53421]|nr:hypothetical protein XH92_36785 [Bradyrhizobium sp. CCBAU 53421]
MAQCLSGNLGNAGDRSHFTLIISGCGDRKCRLLRDRLLEAFPKLQSFIRRSHPTHGGCFRSLSTRSNT